MYARPRNVAAGRAHGFSLIELMITILLLGVVVITLTTVMSLASRSKTVTMNGIEAIESGRVAMDMMARDLRSAGYGADRDAAVGPQPPIAYVDSLQVLINANLEPYPDTLTARAGTPQSYDPAGTGKPRPLIGTEWTPPAKYSTGAEIVRWTLDLNNDGVVDAADLADVNGVEANRSPNPDDFELVRQVYGDSTNNTAGNNGPVTQRVALVRRPGSGIAPMFLVYLRGSTTPWDWSSGPVPATQLGNIERIAIDVTAPSGKRDWRGRYATSRFKTEVNSMRNVRSGARTSTRWTASSTSTASWSTVRATRASAASRARPSSAAPTPPSRAPAATSASPSPRGPTGSSRSSRRRATSTPACPRASRSPCRRRRRATSRTRSWRAATSTSSSSRTSTTTVRRTRGRSAGAACGSRCGPGATSAYTEASGYVSPALFAPVGTCSLTVTAPDSFVVTTTNPVVLSITDGSTESATFGVYKADAGTVSGTVFRDSERDGVFDLGESGIQNVWVGVTTDGGFDVPGYAWTDASGAFSITVPANDPPGTTPYSLMIIPPAGYYPTTTTAINGIYLQAEETLSDRNFGLSSFTVIRLDANRVLSLASADMIEKDWNGNKTANRRSDADIVLGSDTGGSDQVSTWFNQYDSTRSSTRARTTRAPRPGPCCPWGSTG
jgi:prepilin-type N-terminal cleavage/methylation domain